VCNGKSSAQAATIAAAYMSASRQRDWRWTKLAQRHYVRAMRTGAWLVLLLACGQPAPAPTSERRAIAVRQVTPADHEIASEWVRDVADPRDRDVLGVDAIEWRSDRRWQVTVAVMEFIRDVPLESELRRRIAAALRAVPGVTAVAEDDREVWGVRGTPTGTALVEAVAPIVDELAPRSRAEIERQLRESR
jgi:hypothetical protein